MSELPSYTQPTINVEVPQETSLSNMASQQSISIIIDNDLSHESASDGETGIASTSTENADNKSTSNDEVPKASIFDEKAGKKPKSNDKKTVKKTKSKDKIANKPTSDKKVNTQPKSRDSDNANTSTSEQRIQIQTFEQLYDILKEDGKDYLHFKVKRKKKLMPCCSYYHHFVLLEVIEPKKETNENKTKEEQKGIINGNKPNDDKQNPNEEIYPNKEEQNGESNENKPKDDKQNPNEEIYPNKEEQNGESNENENKNDVQKKVKEFNSKEEKSKPKVKEQKEETNENKTNYDEIKVMVAHYTSSKEIFTNNSKFGIGKFIIETVIVKENERNKLFDYKSSKLYLVNQPISTVDHTIRERLYSRLGERIYDFGANNCEHAVNYILTGKAESNIAKSRPRCADLVSAAFGELKEVGLKVAMIIALVSSLAGSLTRYSYVRLLIAGVAAQNANIGVNETCSNLLGDNIIDEAKVVLDKHSEIPRFSEIISSENIITDIKASLKNPFLCEIAELLAMEAIQKTFWLSICMSVSVETMF